MTKDVGDALDIIIWVQAWKSILPMKELEVFKAKKDFCEDWKPASTAEHPHLYKSGKGESSNVVWFGKAAYYSFVSFFHWLASSVILIQTW